MTGFIVFYFLIGWASVTHFDSINELIFWKWISITIAALTSSVFMLVFFVMAKQNRRLLEHHDKVVARYHKVLELCRKHGIKEDE